MKLEDLVQYLDAYLDVRDHPDYRLAVNGLQVQGTRDVSKLAVAVDASFQTIQAAASRDVDFLIVHHGLFWSGLRPVVGRYYQKLKTLMDAGLSLYSVHLPLDGHSEVGNAAVLARALGVDVRAPFGDYEGAPIGWRGHLDMPRETLNDRIQEVTGGHVTLIPGGPIRAVDVGVVTGGGGSMIEAAAAAGLDTYITGEGPHHTFHDAMELGVNVFYAGHYATETWGVRALALHLETEHGLSWDFLDFPTGL
jgi:dinuclear metal center YbgI/SA1388 family protein